MINKLKDAICYALIWIFILMTQACYFEAEEDVDPLQTSDYMDFDDEDDDEEEAEEEKEEVDLHEPGWSLHQMEIEEYHCFDDFYDYVDDTDMFCRCLVEKVSIRWDYDQYKRQEYTYLMRLNDNGTLSQCLKTPDFWQEESEEDIKEDQSFDAEADKKELIDNITQED